MNRTEPGQTKLTICVWHPFSEWRPPASLAEAIGRRWPAMRVVHLPDYDQLPQELPDTDIFVGYSLRAGQLARAGRLKWIHSTAAGVAQLVYPELRDSGITVTNPRGLLSVPMAEHTLGLLIALARSFPDAVRYQDRGHWSQQDLWDHYPLTELSGKLLLIVGFGSIGQEVARRARAFDMRVWGVSRSGRGGTPLAEKIVPVARLCEVLPAADYVVISAPETSETRHLFGGQEISLLKPSACLINVSRGSLLDQAALINALQQNKLAGAALDVTDPEPLPANHPLWKHPHAIVTPHTAGGSPRRAQRVIDTFCENLRRMRTGEPLIALIDKQKGY